MSNDIEDTGMIEVLLQRLNDFRLPRLLELKERVDGGATLTDSDLEFLEHALQDANSSRTVVTRNPEVQPLAAQLTTLYNEIISQGVENEKQERGH